MGPEHSQLHHQAPTTTYEGVGGNDGHGNTLIIMFTLIGPLKQRISVYNSPYTTFRLTFQNESWYVSLEWYFMYLSFLASVHGFMYETNDVFYSVITLSYTKCFVHSYTVDVVFTLS